MNEDASKPPPPEQRDAEEEHDVRDAEIEREALAGRRFSIAEAIGRSAAGLLKGVSPVTRRRQAEVEIETVLEKHLRDAEGALQRVLLRRIVGSEELLKSYREPATAARCVVEGLLGSERRLNRFVTEVDAEWGRIYAETPHFDREGRPPDPGDPYTRDGVRERLADLLESL